MSSDSGSLPRPSHTAGDRSGASRWGLNAAALALASMASISLLHAYADAPDVPRPSPGPGPGPGPQTSPQAPAATSGWNTKLLSLATRQRLFFSYEKRIRDRSSLEKIFEYFCSVERAGSKYMLPLDLLRAIVPTYPASRSSEERGGALAGEHTTGAQCSADLALQNRFFQQFDIDGDGLLGLAEFLLVVTLLRIPQNDVEAIFVVMDLDGNGVIDASEFKSIVLRLQDKANMKGSKARLEDSHSGLLDSFFGPDQAGKLKLEDFVRFLNALHEELVRLEYEHYMPDAEGYRIPGIDFARSLVVAAEMARLEPLLSKVDAAADRLSGMTISFSEFASMSKMQAMLWPLEVALDFVDQIGAGITATELHTLVAQITGVGLSDQVLEVIMQVFDNGKGVLDVPLFLETMRNKGHFWERRGSGSLARNKVQCLWGCWHACKEA